MLTNERHYRSSCYQDALGTRKKLNRIIKQNISTSNIKQKQAILRHFEIIWKKNNAQWIYSEWKWKSSNRRVNMIFTLHDVYTSYSSLPECVNVMLDSYLKQIKLFHKTFGQVDINLTRRKAEKKITQQQYICVYSLYNWNTIKVKCLCVPLV